MSEGTPITITKNPNYAAYERQAKDAQNAAQNAASANPAGIVRDTRNAQTQAIAKGQAQNAQAATPTAVKQPAKPQKKSAPKPSTGNKVLDKLQQQTSEKNSVPTQPQNNRVGTLQNAQSQSQSQSQNNRVGTLQNAQSQSQPMYDKNGNRIIQGNGRFERAQRLAAGQDQVFQNPTGYDVGAVVNQVSQNNQVQGAQPQGAQVQNIFTTRSGNRRFDNAMGYLSNTFNGKTVTTDDGKKVDASRYFQDNLAKLLSNTNNPKALMYGLRSLQEDMARRGVGNFDISGELLKGTGMTDSGFAKQLWGNRQSYLGMLQPNGEDNSKKDNTLPPPPPPPKPKYTHASSKNNYENARANTIVSDDPYKPPVQKNYGSKAERLSARIRAIEANGEKNGQLSSEEYEELANLKKQYNDYMRGVQYHTKGPSWADEINDNLTIRGSKGIRPEGWMDRATRWLNRNAPSVMLTNKNK